MKSYGAWMPSRLRERFCLFLSSSLACLCSVVAKPRLIQSCQSCSLWGPESAQKTLCWVYLWLLFSWVPSPPPHLFLLPRGALILLGMWLLTVKSKLSNRSLSSERYLLESKFRHTLVLFRNLFWAGEIAQSFCKTLMPETLSAQVQSPTAP